MPLEPALRDVSGGVQAMTQGVPSSSLNSRVRGVNSGCANCASRGVGCALKKSSEQPAANRTTANISDTPMNVTINSVTLLILYSVSMSSEGNINALAVRNPRKRI